MCQERLMLNDLSDSGRQPVDCDKIIYATNGEIYNYPEIREKYGKNYNFKGTCDCEAYGCLWEHY